MRTGVCRSILILTGQGIKIVNNLNLGRVGAVRHSFSPANIWAGQPRLSQGAIKSLSIIFRAV